MRIYIEDTDVGGIVYYVNYLKFMERSRTELFRLLGFPKPALIESGKLVVVASTSVDYKRSAKLDDLVHVTASVSKIAHSYICFQQQVYRNEDIGKVVLADAQVKIACVSRDNLKPCALPDNVILAIRNHIGVTEQ